jgi:MFS family permease
VTLTDDAVLVALVAVGRTLPFLLLGLPLGLVVDRFDRRKVALASQAVRGGAMTLVTVVVAADRATIPMLIAAAFMVGMGEILTDGSIPALIRSVVRLDQLEVANARMAAATTVTNAFIGPPLGAALFVVLGWLPFAVIVAGFALAGLLLVALPGDYRPQPDHTEANELMGRLTLGLRYVWNHDVLRPLALTVAAFSFLNEASNGIFVILVTERFGLSEIGYGLLISVDAAVAIITSFFVAMLVRRVGHAGSLRSSMVSYLLAAVFFGFGTTAGLAVAGSVLLGLSNPMWNVVSTTIRQRLVPDHVFGRMMTAYLFIAWGMQPLGALTGGLVARSLGPEWVYILTVPVMGAVFLRSRPLFAAVSRSMTTAPDGDGGSDGP